MNICEIDSKKAKELKLLKKVYNSEEYEITPTEKPDFLIKDKETDEIIGVEITRLYYDQSSARLKEKPNYVSDILNNNICKQDIGILKPCELFVELEGKWVSLGNTVSSPVRTLEDYVDKLCEIIIEKDKKCSNNYASADYYELFIEDKENFLNGRGFGMLNHLYNSEKINEIVYNSKFKRIYFFTNVNKKESLIVMGDIHSGPLYTNEEDIEKHNKYMSELL